MVNLPIFGGFNTSVPTVNSFQVQFVDMTELNQCFRLKP